MNVDHVSSAPLLDGVDGVNQTLAAMAALVRRDASNLTIRNKALEITQGCDGHDFQCEIQALFEYCRSQITYRRDPVETELVQDAARTLFTFGVGDCDDKVVCLATLLATLGHKSRFKVLGQTRGHYSHVYLEVQTKSGYLALDPTPEQAPAGWEARGQAATYEIFNQPVSPMLLIGAALLLWYLLK